MLFNILCAKIQFQEVKNMEKNINLNWKDQKTI